MKKLYRLLVVFTLALSIFTLSACGQREAIQKEAGIKEDGYYTSKDDVALYIVTYNKLPANFITKSEAKKLGWVAEEGNLWEVSDHKSIGGDRFRNYEKLLPEDSYFECDIDYEGGQRNKKRLVYTEDGIVYYTEDHYESFKQLYGE